MANELITKFIFDESEASKRIDLTRKNLFALNNDFNNLGKNLTVGKTIANDLNTASRAADSFKNKVQDSFKTLGAEAINQARGEKAIEQAKRATLQTQAEEIKLERQQIGLKRDQLRLQQQISNFKSKSDPGLKAAAADIKSYQQQTIQGEKAVTKSIEREAKLQADARIREGKRAANDALRTVNQKTPAGGGGGSSFVSGLGNNAILAGVTGGLIGAGAVGSLMAVQSVLSSITDTAADLSVKSIRLAGDFELTTNSMTVFAGSTRRAQAELSSIAKTAKDTPGLGLIDAETGAVRLRALNFEFKAANDLMVGLAKHKILSGADEQALGRVVVNVTQLASGSHRVQQDIKEMVLAMPTLRRPFLETFGSIEGFKKQLDVDPKAALAKFAAVLAQTKAPVAGFNDALIKLNDQFIISGRNFGQPILEPFTNDVRNLTKFIDENQNKLREWGQYAADVYQGVSGTAQYVADRPAAGFAVRSYAATATLGISEGVIGSISSLQKLGEHFREAEEAKKSFDQRFSAFDKNLLNSDFTVNFGGETTDERKTREANEKFEADQIAEKNKESLLKKKEENLKRQQSLIELQRQLDLSEIQNNLDYQKANLSSAKETNSLKTIREAAFLEETAIRRQIIAQNNYAQNMRQNLTPDEFNAGKGFQISKENANEIAKLNNQLVISQINAQKAVQDEIERGKTKVKELEKTFNSIFDSLYSKTGSNNPFVSVFSEADKALKDLRENLRGLSPELQSQAIALQNKINGRALFETRVDNALDVFDLRSRADQFRNAGQTEAEKKRFEEVSRRGYLGNDFNSLNDTEKRDAYERRLIASNDFSLNPNLIGALASDRLRGNNPNQSVNDRLQSQIKILDSFASTDEEKASADRRLVSLSSSINPNELNPQLREKVATANERLADRREKYEQEALKIERDKLAVQQQIAENGKKLLELAEKEGFKGIENVVRIINDAGDAAQITRAPTAKDTAAQYGAYQNALDF